jgi:hypothetical protein
MTTIATAPPAGYVHEMTPIPPVRHAGGHVRIRTDLLDAAGWEQLVNIPTSGRLLWQLGGAVIGSNDLAIKDPRAGAVLLRGHDGTDGSGLHVLLLADAWLTDSSRAALQDAVDAHGPLPTCRYDDGAVTWGQWDGAFVGDHSAMVTRVVDTWHAHHRTSAATGAYVHPAVLAAVARERRVAHTGALVLRGLVVRARTDVGADELATTRAGDSDSLPRTVRVPLGSVPQPATPWDSGGELTAEYRAVTRGATGSGAQLGTLSPACWDELVDGHVSGAAVVLRHGATTVAATGADGRSIAAPLHGVVAATLDPQRLDARLFDGDVRPGGAARHVVLFQPRWLTADLDAKLARLLCSSPTPAGRIDTDTIVWGELSGPSGTFSPYDAATCDAADALCGTMQLTVPVVPRGAIERVVGPAPWLPQSGQHTVVAGHAVQIA